MKISETKLLQKYLKKENFYHGKIDGAFGPISHQALLQALEQRSSLLKDGWNSWSKRRQTVAYLQIIAQEAHIDAGVIDGYYGPQTANASERLRQLEEDGLLQRGFDDIIVTERNPHHFPMEKFELLNNYYGPPCEAEIVYVSTPWKLRLDWNLNASTSKIAIHKKLAPSLEKIVTSVFDTYGLDGIKEHGLDRYGGSYNCRKKRGSSHTWSTHSWGIAIDWFPSKNALRVDDRTASLAQEDLDPWWKIWEDEGWLSLGRKENRDWMHIQAAKR